VVQSVETLEGGKKCSTKLFPVDAIPTANKTGESDRGDESLGKRKTRRKIDSKPILGGKKDDSSVPIRKT